MKPVLRPVEPADLQGLYRAESSADRFTDWRFRGLTLAPHQFGAMNSSRLLRNYVLASCEPLALVALHSLSATDEVAEVACTRFGAPGPQFGAAVALVLDEAFDLGLRQVRAEVAEFNLPSIEPILGLFFERESIERGAVYHRARYWDLHGLVLRRDRWIEEVRPWLGRARTLLDFRPVGLTGLTGPGPTRAARGEA